MDLCFQARLQTNKASPRHRDIEIRLPEIVGYLAEDQSMPEKYRDHTLGGNWKDHRECHLKPDLLLIYKKPDNATLRLVRMESHSELFRK
jgi:mRNA interferase YafQ